MVEKVIEITKKWSVSKKILSFPIIVIFCCLIGYSMLVGVYSIPTEGRMCRNMIKSAEIFKQEGAYTDFIGRGGTLDNFTDALMLLSADYRDKSKSIFVNAIDIPRKSVQNLNPADSVVCIYLNNEKNFETLTYGRYWHGYLTFLKPLLWLFSYRHIRDLLMFLQIGMFLFLFYELFEQKKMFVLPFCITYIFLNPVSTILSLQFSSMTITMFSGLFGVLWLYKKKISLYLWCIFFMLIGCVASYFDLLTFPSITLGIPLLLWYSFYYADGVKVCLKKGFKISLAWVFGYGGFWISKWILGTLITGNNLVKNGLMAAAFRSSGGYHDKVYTVLGVLTQRLKTVDPMFWVVLAIVIFVLVREIWERKIKIDLKIGIPVFIIMLYSVIWYLGLRNHSGIHWFTYRTLVMIPCGILTYLGIIKEVSKNENNSSTNPVL